MNMRSLHRWVSVIIAIPLFIIVGSGIILASRGFWPWMQPEYPMPAQAEMKIGFPEMLAAVQSVPAARMQSWADVSQIDVRPKTGQIRLRSKFDHWEVQVDPGTGRVLGYGQRRVGWFTALHQGALWGEFPRYGIFYVSAWGLFFLLISGLVIFFKPYANRFRKKKYMESKRKPTIPVLKNEKG